ncbi:MAG: TlpA family protein disulfide reductase [Candidatus Omnitrophica bacterium]|nr:TlpA family protein disulfide reductase [Candidatus Omnitrophota bacterium]
MSRRVQIGVVVLSGLLLAAAASAEFQAAPDFAAPGLDGKPVKLSDFRGKVVILDFWATWCPPCRQEIPHFKALYSRYQARGLEVVGLALDQNGAAAVRPFVQAEGITYPVAIGNQKITADYGGIRGIPTTFIIDRKGKIVRKFVGYQEMKVFESAIEPLL